MPKGFPTNGEMALSPDGLLPAYGDEDTVEEVLAKRQKTGGRLKGTPNHQKKFELKKTAQLYGLRAVATMIEIMEDESLPATVRLQAANDIIDRGFGKATQHVEHAGVDGDEIKSRLIIEFVGQVPQLQDAQPNLQPAAIHGALDPAATHVANSALNSPFRNAQLGRAPYSAPLHNKDDITDAVHKMVSVPVFKNPWD